MMLYNLKHLTPESEIVWFPKYVIFFKDIGGKRFDPKQDASYFGVWVHEKNQRITTFTEKDQKEAICPLGELFRRDPANGSVLRVLLHRHSE